MKRISLVACWLVALLLFVPLAPGARAQAPEEGPLIEGDPLDPSALPGAEGAPPAAGPAELTFWCSAFPLEQGWAVRVTREWNATHPDHPVRLQALPTERLAEEVFREALREGTAPDLTNHLFPVDGHGFAEQGALLALDELPELMRHLAERSGPGADRLFRARDGHLYQFPWKNNPILFQYNPELFRGHGIRPPRTYPEFLQAGRDLAAATPGRKTWLWAPSPSASFWERYYDFFPLYLAASGGRGLLTPDGRAAFDNEAGVAVMTFLAEIHRQGLAPREALYDQAGQQLRGFLDESLAMVMMGPWNIEELRDAGGDRVSFDFVGLPVPEGFPADQPVYTYGNFRNFGIFKNCHNPALAAEFIRFATSREHDLALLETASQLPYRTGLTDDPDFVRVLQHGPAPLAKFALQVPWVRPVDPVPDLNDILKILSEELQKAAIDGTKDPRQAIRDAARRINERPGRS